MFPSNSHVAGRRGAGMEHDVQRFPPLFFFLPEELKTHGICPGKECILMPKSQPFKSLSSHGVKNERCPLSISFFELATICQGSHGKRAKQEKKKKHAHGNFASPVSGILIGMMAAVRKDPSRSSLLLLPLFVSRSMHSRRSVRGGCLESMSSARSRNMYCCTHVPYVVRVGRWCAVKQ